jgi:hypothetical protein
MPLDPSGVHGAFVALGTVAAVALFLVEARRRRTLDDRLFIILTGSLFCGAVAAKLSTAWRYFAAAPDPTLIGALIYGGKSVLGGLAGAYVGAILTKRLIGYRASTGDVFAPAVALGIGIGRFGCLLTETPGTPTGLPWGGDGRRCAGGADSGLSSRLDRRAAPSVVRLRDRLPLRHARRAAAPAAAAGSPGRAVQGLPPRLRRFPLPDRIRPRQPEGLGGADPLAALPDPLDAAAGRLFRAPIPDARPAAGDPRSPGGRAMTDPGLDPILAYLRQHSAQYSLEALREQLVRSGYHPAEVDQAVALYQEQNPPAPRSRVFPKALLVVAVNAVLTVGALRVQGVRSDILSSFYMLLIGAELVAGFVACFPAKSRSWGLALLLGFVITVALGILALGGFCLYILSKGANH